MPHDTTTPTLPPPSEEMIAGIALFLDFDGTLVEIVDRPDAVKVDDRLRGLVAAVARRLEGRLAIVSGRTIDELVAFLGPLDGCAVAGSHGLETLLHDGRRAAPDPPEALAELISATEAFAAPMPGVMVEPKPFGVAIHFRASPDAAAAVEAFAREIADDGIYALQHGKMVVELRAAGADKGDAVEALLAMAPMAGARPIFIGDDLTDEAGFRAARAAGGIGVLVGDRGDTAATYRLPDVTAVHAWLSTIAERIPA